MRESNLTHVHLSGAYLAQANLSNANLSNANLNRIDLRQANLSGADCKRAELRYADLRGANLSNTNLNNVNLNGADLSNSDLSGAQLRDSYLYRANLKNISYDNNTKWLNARWLHKTIDVPEELKIEAEFGIAILLSEGMGLAEEGKIEEAIKKYEQVEEEIAVYNENHRPQPKLEISVAFWNQLGWSGCLHGFAKNVMFACENAISGDSGLPEMAQYLDTRGLAKALTGDVTGAINDFQATLDSGKFSEAQIPKRKRWLESLQAGNNRG